MRVDFSECMSRHVLWALRAQHHYSFDFVEWVGAAFSHDRPATMNLDEEPAEHLFTFLRLLGRAALIPDKRIGRAISRRRREIRRWLTAPALEQLARVMS